MAVDSWLWFLNATWIMVSVWAGGIACLVHFVFLVVICFRIGAMSLGWGGLVGLLILPAMTFVSCIWYTIIMAMSVGYVYEWLGRSPSSSGNVWSVGFAFFYCAIKYVQANWVR